AFSRRREALPAKLSVNAAISAATMAITTSTSSNVNPRAWALQAQASARLNARTPRVRAGSRPRCAITAAGANSAVPIADVGIFALAARAGVGAEAVDIDVAMPARIQ